MQRRLFIVLFAVLIFLNIYCEAYAESRGTAFVVVIDNISINDINKEELTGFNQLMQEGSVGLLNNNTGGSINSPSTHVTIGTGSHAVGSSIANQAYNVSARIEEGMVKDVYHQRTGITPPDDSVVQLGIARLKNLNSDLSRSVQIGALGTALHREGIKTAVFGNSDLKDKLGRLSVCIAMDENGVVDYGEIDSQVLINDNTFPGGKRTNYPLLLKSISQSKSEHGLIVVDLGDISRLHSMQDYLDTNVYEQNYQLTLERMDNFLAGLASSMSETDLLMVISPTPKKSMLNNKKMLTPIIRWGPGYKHDPQSERGLLISGTTKHPGIVMNTDIAPTILTHLNVDYSTVISGRPMYEIPVTYNTANYLQQKQEKLSVTYKARPPLQQGYVLFQIIILAVSLWLIFKDKKGAKIKLISPLILLMVSVPLAYLILPLLPQPSVPVVTVELVTVAMAITVVSLLMGRGNFMNSFGIVALATMGMLLLDIFLGQPLQKQAILSYDPMVGARFYGIGNEYMGVLIGATIMSASLLINNFNRYRKQLIAFAGVIFITTIILMAAPQFGTNVGGTIAASSAFLVTFLLYIGIRFSPKAIIGVAATVVLLLLGFILFDLSRPIQQQSHIGQTARLIIDGGLVEVFNIINRKLGMNLKLLRYTVWSKVLLASIITLAILFYKPRGVMQIIKNEYPFVFKGFIGVVTGALVAFAFNDSGVVAAATTMIFGAPPLIIMVLNEQLKGGY
ncbi:MAG: hypothetical protein FH758_12995 [Firmicutes bacterium]|nr:hypothetical protein [Bacillota bacterium]